MDSVLIDTNPATFIRPAGILNGVSGLTPTAGVGFTALVGDIKQLTNALLTGTLGNIRNPVWLMNPAQVNSIGLVAAPGAGVFPFREEIGTGRLGGWPVIGSCTVPPGTVIVLMLPTLSVSLVMDRALKSVTRQPCTWRIPRRPTSAHPAPRLWWPIREIHVPDRQPGAAPDHADQLDIAPRWPGGLGGRCDLVNCQAGPL